MSGGFYNRPRDIAKITGDTHAIIQASAGTGKTYFLEHLVVDLIVGGRAKIDQILAVTFTEKATAELVDRIRARIIRVYRGEPASADAGVESIAMTAPMRSALDSALRSFDRANIQTIHAFCHQALREFAILSGAPLALEVIDGKSAFMRAAEDSIRAAQAQVSAQRAALSEWLARDSEASLLEFLWNAYDKRYHHCADYMADTRGNSARAAVNALLPGVIERLDRRKRSGGTLAFDDMLAWLWKALKPPAGDALARAMRDRYRWGLIDEFQDTDDLQWQIFKRIFVEPSNSRLIVIGDPKQAIYEFRGADVYTYRNAVDEMRRLNAVEIPLEDNYRSTAAMVDAINLILDHNAKPPLFAGSFITYDKPVRCARITMTATDTSGAIAPLTLFEYAPESQGSAPDFEDKMARAIAREIAALVGDVRRRITIAKTAEPYVASPGSIMVLTRTNDEGAMVAKCLREAGVPYVFYKRKGLSTRPEVDDILSVLRAVEDPSSRSRRMAAWTTPIFARPMDELPRLARLDTSHPLINRLYEWNRLAEDGRFGELFDAMLDGAGLAARELLDPSGHRDLGIYQQIFEMILREASIRRPSLRELIEALREFRQSGLLPASDDADIERASDERDAVRISTIHGAKGLEADIVFVLGSLGRSGIQKKEIYVTHRAEPDGTFARQFNFEPDDDAKVAINRELDEAGQRLSYVAITRACAKMYLCVAREKSMSRMNGVMRFLNDRLNALAREASKLDSAAHHLIEVRKTGDESGSTPRPIAGRVSPRKWKPAPALFIEDAPPIDFDTLRHRSRAMIYTSYTALRDSGGRADRDLEPIEFKSDAAREDAVGGGLRGGAAVGVFIHESIEQLDLRVLAAAPDFEAWAAMPEVDRLFRDRMRKNAVSDSRWLDEAKRIVYRALAQPIRLNTDTVVRLADSSATAREMGFVFPIPARRSARDESARGYTAGFIDFVFEAGGRTYFADWKSDWLAAYDRASLDASVAAEYEIQQLIYTLGVARLLGIRDRAGYDARFGGLVYVYLRGVGGGPPAADGIWFHRPTWDEYLDYEEKLASRI
jgi:exodeoxyribonuclease V beta subunit